MKCIYDDVFLLFCNNNYTVIQKMKYSRFDHSSNNPAVEKSGSPSVCW